MLFATGCSIAPENVERVELKQNITSISAPSITGIIVNNDASSPSVTVEWTTVDNATYYEFEYYKAQDYLTGAGAKTIVTQTTSCTLTSEYFVSSDDMRYVFRVRAANKNGSNRAILYSSYSSVGEAVVLNSFSVNPIIRNNQLYLYASFPKIKSVLDDDNMVQPVIGYYDGDYTNGETLPQALASSVIPLSSAEEKTITAVLFVDGKEIVRDKIEVTNSVDYYPSALLSLEGTTGQDGYIGLKWKANGINAGLESYNPVLKFYIERREVSDSSSSEWTILKNTDGGTLYVTEADSDGTYSCFDRTAEAGKDYQYRVISEYVLTFGENNVVTFDENVDSARLSDICYVADTEVKSFIVTTESGFTGAPVTEGDAEYVVSLKWETYHTLSDDMQFVVTRCDFDQTGEETSSSEPVVFSAGARDCIDIFTLTEEENRKACNFIYYIRIVKKDETEATNSRTAAMKLDGNGNEVEGILTTNPSVRTVRFVSSIDATRDDAAYSDRIRVSWTLDTEEIEKAGLDISSVYVKVLKKAQGEASYSELDGKIMGKAAGGPDDVVYTYDDSDSLKAGESYSYMLRPYYDDESSQYSGAQAVDSDRQAEGNILKAVSGISASVNTSNAVVCVKWNRVDNAAGYAVCSRKSGSDSWNECAVISDPETVEYNVEGLEAGVSYEFAVTVVDKYGNSAPVTDDTVTAPGSVLGTVTPRVSGPTGLDADSIFLEWDEVENATGYTVTVYDDSGRQIFSELVTGKTSFVLSADSEIISAFAETEGYALSRKYSFSVTPKVGSVTPLSSSPVVEGYWLMPPKNVTATRAAYRDLITISWDAVPGATGYVVYSRDHGTDGEWEYLDVVSGGTTSYDYLTSTQKLDFTVSTLSGSLEGPVQDYFESGSNYGYALSVPQRLTGSDVGSGLFKLSFRAVEGATDYVFYTEGSEFATLSVSDISTTRLTSYSAGSAELSEDGIVSYYFTRPAVKARVIISFGVAARNSNSVISSKNTTSSATTNVMYASLSDDEIVSIAFNNLRPVFTLVDGSFDREWWPSSQKTLSESGLEASSCHGTTDFIKYNPANNGYINLTNYASYENTISGKISCYVEKDQTGGYLGDDPLERVTTTEDIVIQLPGKYEDIVVSFSDYRVDNTSGTVTVNGKTVDLSSIKTKLL